MRAVVGGVREWLRGERGRWLVAALLIVAGVFLVHRESLSYLFTSEDWHVVGPPAAKRFLDNPLSLLGFSFGGHYQPVAGLFFALESLAFLDHALGYHLVSLALLSGLSLLLLGFLRAFGVGHLPALLVSLLFALDWSSIHLVLQVYNQHYFLLGILLLGSLLLWERYQKGGMSKDLAWTFALLGASQYVHATAAVFPLLLAVPFLFRGASRGRPEGGRKRGGIALLLLFGMVVLLQAAPRLLLGMHMEGTGASPSFNPGGFLKALWLIMAATPRVLHHYLPFPAFLALALLLGTAVAAWASRPRLVPLLVLGAVAIPATFAPPFFVLGWDPEFIATRYRYLFLPTLGMALVLGALLDALAGRRRRWPGWAGGWAAAGFALLFLVGSVRGSENIYRNAFGPESRYINSVVSAYLKTAERLSRDRSCGTITLFDVPLEVTRPTGARNLLTAGLDHRTIHGFHFALDREKLERFRFLPPFQSAGDRRDPCEFTVVMGIAKRRQGSAPLP